MARLRDVPYVLRTVGPFTFLLRVWRQGTKDQLMTWASALAYSWLFAVFPFFIFLLTFVPNLRHDVKTRVAAELKQVIYSFPKDAADALWTNVETQVLNPAPGNVWLRVLGLGIALWAASGGMSTTMTALDRCYELKDGRAFYWHRMVAMLMTVVVAALVLAVMLLLPVGGLVKSWIISKHWEGFHEGAPWLRAFDVARVALAAVFMVLVLTVLYHWGPYVRHRFQLVTPGAVFCILVWVALGLVFKLYFERFATYNKTYGTVGGVAVMLIVFYIDAAVLLWGAELNSEIDFEVLKVERGTRDFIPAEVEVEVVGPEAVTLPEPDEPPPT